MTKRLLLMVSIAVASASCKKVTDAPAITFGTYVSVNELTVDPPVMYTFGMYSTGGKPITETTIIKEYIKRKNLTGFIFDSAIIHSNVIITLKAVDNDHLTLTNGLTAGPAEGSFAADGGHQRVSNTGPTFVNLLLSDPLPSGTVSNDSCYRKNAYYTFFQTVNWSNSDHASLAVAYLNPDLQIHFVTSSFTRNNGTGACSSFLSNTWGYDIQQDVWNDKQQWVYGPLASGDTLLLQTKKRLLKKQ